MLYYTVSTEIQGTEHRATIVWYRTLQWRALHIENCAELLFLLVSVLNQIDPNTQRRHWYPVLSCTTANVNIFRFSSLFYFHFYFHCILFWDSSLRFDSFYEESNCHEHIFMRIFIWRWLSEKFFFFFLFCFVKDSETIQGNDCMTQWFEM